MTWVFSILILLVVLGVGRGIVYVVERYPKQILIVLFLILFIFLTIAIHEVVFHGV